MLVSLCRRLCRGPHEWLVRIGEYWIKKAEVQIGYLGSCRVVHVIDEHPAAMKLVGRGAAPAPYHLPWDTVAGLCRPEPLKIGDELIRTRATDHDGVADARVNGHVACTRIAKRWQCRISLLIADVGRARTTNQFADRPRIILIAAVNGISSVTTTKDCVAIIPRIDRIVGRPTLDSDLR